MCVFLLLFWQYIHEEEADQYFSDAGIIQSSSAKADESRRSFPSSVVPKTDERRLQDNPNLLEYIADRNIVVTRKEDGSSATFAFKDGNFSICGRNFTWLTPCGASKNYYLIANKFNLEDGMTALQRNIAIQGELIGPKINANRMRLEDYQFRVFNIYDIDEKTYLPWAEVEAVCVELKLATVPVIYQGPAGDLQLTVPAFLLLAEQQKYTSQTLAEGIVVKTDDYSSRGRVSFKVISNKYLLKHKL